MMRLVKYMQCVINLNTSTGLWYYAAPLGFKASCIPKPELLNPGLVNVNANILLFDLN